MDISRFFDWFGVGVLAALAVLAVPRAMYLKSRGIRVLVVDRQRTAGQIVQDLIAMVGLLIWSYELVAAAWLLGFHPVPASLAVVLSDWLPLKVAGGLLMITGVAVYGLGTRGLGESWRLGIDRKKAGPLMRNGIFARTRNPIYLSFDLLLTGTFFVHGRLHLLLLALVVGAVMHLQILREERFLSERHGDAYGSYCARVGRYMTWRWKT